DGDGVEGDARSVLRRHAPDRAGGAGEPDHRHQRAGHHARPPPGPDAGRPRAEPQVDAARLIAAVVALTLILTAPARFRGRRRALRFGRAARGSSDRSMRTAGRRDTAVAAG